VQNDRKCMRPTVVWIEVNAFSVFPGHWCAPWSLGLKPGARVQRLIADGRTKTRPETTAIMREIDTLERRLQAKTSLVT